MSNWPTESQNNSGALEDALSREHTFPGNQGTTAGVHRAATTSLTGTMRIATAAECQTGTDNTTAVSPLGLQAGVSTAGNTSYGRLKVHNNSGTPLTKVDITARSAVLAGTTENYRALNVSVTVDATVTGANGIDLGSLAGSTWYYFYIIGKADGTISGLVSLSPTSPTMPTDYIYKLMVCADITDASSHFLPFRQYANKFRYASAVSALSAGSAATLTSVSLITSLPPNLVNEVLLHVNVLAGGYDGAGCLSYDGVNIFHNQNVTSFMGSHQSACQAIMPVAVSQTIYYEVTGATNELSLDVEGFELDI